MLKVFHPPTRVMYFYLKMVLHWNCPTSFTKYGIELSNAATVFVHVSKDDGLQILERIQISWTLK